MTEPIDNTEFLMKVHDVLDLGESVKVKLRATAVSEQQKENVELLVRVLDMHADVIRKLTENQLNIVDHIDALVRKMGTSDATD